MLGAMTDLGLICYLVYAVFMKQLFQVHPLRNDICAFRLRTPALVAALPSGIFWIPTNSKFKKFGCFHSCLAKKM